MESGRRFRGCMFAGAGFATAIVLAAVIGVIALRATFSAHDQRASSMEPTVVKGEKVLVARRARTFRRGDVVVVAMPTGGRAIKRMIGLPGETIELRGGLAIVNGVPLHEPYVELREGADPQLPVFRDMPPVAVPPDSYFVLGDNRDHSNDSRFIGPVPRKNIGGRVVLVISQQKGVRRPARGPH